MVLRGSTDSILDDLERAVDDGVNTYKVISAGLTFFAPVYIPFLNILYLALTVLLLIILLLRPCAETAVLFLGLQLLR